jgi:hypothetical protein
MWATIKTWLASKKISAHTLATVWVGATILWSTSPPFHDYLMGIYNALPKGVHQFIAGVIVPALIYWHVQKTTTVSATLTPGETGAAVIQAKATENKVAPATPPPAPPAAPKS